MTSSHVTDALGAEITELCSYIHAAESRLLTLIHKLDERAFPRERRDALPAIAPSTRTRQSPSMLLFSRTHTRKRKPPAMVVGAMQQRVYLTYTPMTVFDGNVVFEQ